MSYACENCGASPCICDLADHQVAQEEKAYEVEKIIVRRLVGDITRAADAELRERESMSPTLRRLAARTRRAINSQPRPLLTDWDAVLPTKLKEEIRNG